MMGGANMQQMMRKAQKLQEQMTKAQEELEAREYEASAGGGMVSVKVNGKHELLGLSINPEAVDPEDVAMLQDMVLAAVNEALRGVAAQGEERLAAVTGGMGGLGIPGLF